MMIVMTINIWNVISLIWFIRIEIDGCSGCNLLNGGGGDAPG